MFHNNPYGVWATGGNGQSGAWDSNPPPSIYGALPYTNISSPSNLVVFHATSFSPSVLNSTVVGPQGQVYFQIVTDNELSGYTVFKDGQGRNIALIEWKSPPSVEVRGIISKTSARSWLRLSADRSSRSMEIRGMRYTWAPSNQSINLYTGESANATFLARVSRTQTSLMIEMTPDALQLGLLNTTVVAALLLQCGRNID